MEVLLGSYEPECLCTPKPLMISNNVTFLISEANFKNVNDIVYDEMGAFKYKGSPLKRFDLEHSARSLKMMPSEANGSNLYTFKRIYYDNKSSPDLLKIVSTVINTCEFGLILGILSYK